MASIIAIGTLILTATGLFIELQSDLNTIWGVEGKPWQGIWGFIKNRLLSFAMVIAIGFLLLVSLVVSAALAAVGKYFTALMPGLNFVWTVVNWVVSFGGITVLFAMIFKVPPDVKIAWRDVWIGAGLTSLLFTPGKTLLGLYLGRNSTVTAYGAAGSLVLILLWVYYLRSGISNSASSALACVLMTTMSSALDRARVKRKHSFESSSTIKTVVIPPIPEVHPGRSLSCYRAARPFP